MGFIPSGGKDKQEFHEQIKDLYIMLRLAENQLVSAQNLETMLLAISGIQDKENYIPNTIQNTQWNLVGELKKGVQRLRQGEFSLIQTHFKLLYLTRLQLKKALREYKQTEKSAVTFHPVISTTSKLMADIKRTKTMTVGAKQDIVSVLTDDDFSKKTKTKIADLREQK